MQEMLQFIKYLFDNSFIYFLKIEWLFTPIPKMFGLIPGYANLTGWALVIIFTLMVTCSLPFVRKRGLFEVFYWTHLLYIPFWILLIIHGPSFYIWFVGPGFIFILEKLVGFHHRWVQYGKTYISSATVFPSGVTHLVIKKPPNFRYHPGDYVFVKIKTIAAFEWHPFTISSAPELPSMSCIINEVSKLLENSSFCVYRPHLAPCKKRWQLE